MASQASVKISACVITPVPTPAGDGGSGVGGETDGAATLIKKILYATKDKHEKIKKKINKISAPS